MKIEFRKVPQQPKEFLCELTSVKFLGTFCKISSKLVDVKSKIEGDVEVNCCKCGVSFNTHMEENINFLLSDGIYSSDDERDLDKIIIEITNNLIDFEEILQSEIDSFASDYHVCDNCKKDDNTIEIEY